jgi:hypothetical protein
VNARATRNAPQLLLLATLLVAAVVTLVLVRHLTFFADSWEILMNRRHFTSHAILEPHNEHIVVLPVLITQLFLRIFGMSSAMPEFVLLTIGLLATAVLVFEYVRRRIGPWPGLFAAALILFLGPAFEVLLWTPASASPSPWPASPRSSSARARAGASAPSSSRSRSCSTASGGSAGATTPKRTSLSTTSSPRRATSPKRWRSASAR